MQGVTADTEATAGGLDRVPGRRGEDDRDLHPGPEDLGIDALDPENPAGGLALTLRIKMKERKTESEDREDFPLSNPRRLAFAVLHFGLDNWTRKLSSLT